MARVTGRKLRVSHQAQGGAMPFDFGAPGEYQVYGFHMHPQRRIQVEVPIFDHGFYPKLDHTPTDIKQEIKYRVVSMPSLADLRKAGIDAQHAVYAADVWVHPRYIKHKNYFRTDFPANMKAYAKREGVVIVFPANDMIAARFKRKETLQLWRAAFTPLLIEGRQYTSGRITHFFASPPAVSQKFRMHLNLEHDEEANNLVEWDPATWQLAQSTPRNRRPSRAVPLDDREVERMAEKLADEIAPLVSSKVDGSMTPDQKHRLHDIIADGEMAEALVHETKGKEGTPRLAAAKRWVRRSAWPRIKDFLVQEGIEVSRAVGSFIWMTAIAIAVNNVVDNFKGTGGLKGDALSDWQKKHPWRTRVGKYAQDFQYNMHPEGVTLGSGTLTYTGGQRVNKDKLTTILREQALQLYTELARDPQIGLSGEDIFDLSIQGNRVKVTVDQARLMGAIRHGEIEGKFVYTDPGTGRRKINLTHANRVNSVIRPGMERRLTQSYNELKKQGY